MTASSDALDALGLSPALGKIIRFYLVRPGAHPHQRALQRTLGLGSASVQRETERLQRLGLLRAEKVGGRTAYSVFHQVPLWRALEDLERASEDPTAILRDALIDVEGILTGFVFGSVARGTHRQKSDLDLFVLEGPDFDRRAFYRNLSEVTLLMGREVHSIRYSPHDLGKRLGDPSHPGRGFLRKTLAGEKIWVAGSFSELAPIAAAAGLPSETLE